MNLNEIKRMQFLAGIISENNMDPLEVGRDISDDVTARDVDMDALEAMPEIDMAAQMISQNPNALAQLERLASAAGIDAGLNEMEDDSSDIQRLADVIDGILYSKGLNEENSAEAEEEQKVDPVVTAASIGGILPFIPGISGWFAAAAAATGIPAVALGAGSVVAAAIVGAIIKKIKENKQ